MEWISERLDLDPERLWAALVAALAIAATLGSVLFPRTVYDGFIWRYFWGPVQADANAAYCAVRRGGTVRYLDSADACANAAGSVAYPGYTLVSEVGYVVVLLLALTGLVFLLRRLDVGTEIRFFYALLPFVFFGGALRVVEDATDAPGADTLVSYPWNALIISPIIYFTVFFVTLAALVGSVALARRGITESYERPLFAVGVAVLAVSLGYLFTLGVTGARGATFYPQVLAVVLVGATLSTAVTWWALVRFFPGVVAGSGSAGAVVVWGHAVDGVANVVGLDWMVALNAGSNLVPKHPVNRAVVDVTAAVLPQSVLAVTGDTWPFLLLKLVAASLVVAIFDEQLFEENPRYAVLLLVAVLAVGLGPGTRDMLRATFGV